MTTVASLLAYDPNKVKPGWIAFFIVMALCVATFFLWRSMNTQLGKIRAPPRASFGPDRREPTGEPGPGNGPQAEGEGLPSTSPRSASPEDDPR